MTVKEAAPARSGSMSGAGAGAGAGAGDGGRAEWQRIYDLVEAQVEELAAGRSRLEAINGIQHEFWNARDKINQALLHQAELSRNRWEATCRELLPGDSPKLAELLESDLEDARFCEALFDIENSELKIHLEEVGSCVELKADHEHTATNLTAELRKLKQAFQTMCSNKDNEVSLLRAEKDFVSNQLRSREKDNAAAILQIKELERARAIEATHKLQKNAEVCRVAARNKDGGIRRSQADTRVLKNKKLPVPVSKLHETHSFAKDHDIQKLKAGQSTTLKRKCASLPNANMWIVIEDFFGKKIPLEVNASDTIASVKAKIQDKEGLPPNEQFLVFVGKQLEDCHTLAEYNIRNDSTVNMFVQSSGKCIHVYISGNFVPIRLESSDTVADVKAKIEAREGVPPSRQELWFGVKQLEENTRALADYGVKRESCLLLRVCHPPGVHR